MVCSINKKYTTLCGGILIHLSLGSFYTFGNLTPYLTSYLREVTGSNTRYTDTNWIYSTISICMALSSVCIGLFIAKYRPSLKLVIFIGCLIMSSGWAITYFTIKKSFFLTLLTLGIINGIGAGISYLTPLEVSMKVIKFKNNHFNSLLIFFIDYLSGFLILKVSLTQRFYSVMALVVLYLIKYKLVL